MDECLIMRNDKSWKLFTPTEKIKTVNSCQWVTFCVSLFAHHNDIQSYMLKKKTKKWNRWRVSVDCNFRTAQKKKDDSKTFRGEDSLNDVEGIKAKK